MIFDCCKDGVCDCDEESNLINNAAYTHDYEEEALASFAAGNDIMDELTERFEASIAYDEAVDVGGICKYYTNGALTAFYDYENFVGSDKLYIKKQ